MTDMKWKIKPAGDHAVLVEMGSCISETVNRQVMLLEDKISNSRIPGILETVPAFASLLVCYQPLVTDDEEVTAAIRRLADGLDEDVDRKGRTVEIPVCYGGQYGEDLDFVAKHAGLSPKEVIRIHSGREYRIYMLGFLPGFPYLGGLDKRLFTPRLSNPRTKIPAGSVGIGGEQTGIYPLDSPGGWQLIGQTPCRLFSPDRDKTMLYEAGDRIRFVPIGPDEFERIKAVNEGWEMKDRK